MGTFSSHHLIYPSNYNCNCCLSPFCDGECVHFPDRRRYFSQRPIPPRFCTILPPLELGFFGYPLCLLHYQYLPLFWVFCIKKSTMSYDPYSETQNKITMYFPFDVTYTSSYHCISLYFFTANFFKALSVKSPYTHILSPLEPSPISL